MLTAQAPPRIEDAYASHHTLNAEIEVAEPPQRKRVHSVHVVEIPDLKGEMMEINLEHYDPSEFPSHDPFSPLTPSISNQEDELSSPSTSPPNSGSFSSNYVLSSYTADITEQQLLDTVTQRAQSLKKQYEVALQLQEQVFADAALKTKMLECLNERRRVELRRERERMAERCRKSTCIEDL